jgi:hypothetical protein
MVSCWWFRWLVGYLLCCVTSGLTIGRVSCCICRGLEPADWCLVRFLFDFVFGVISFYLFWILIYFLFVRILRCDRYV